MAKRRISLMIGVFILAGILISLSCNLPFSSQGGKKLTQEEALQLVLDEIVKPDQLGDDPLVIFAWPDPLLPDDFLHPYASFGEDPNDKQITVKSEGWFFWIEDEPMANFTHPTRYVLVDIKSGKISVSDQEWWPVLNGQGLWISDEDYENEENWAWSNITFQEPVENSNLGSSSILAALLPPRQESSQAEGGTRRALVINTATKDQKATEDHAADAKNMLNILAKNDFETTYFGPDSDNNQLNVARPFLPHPHTDPWREWLRYMEEVMNPGDTLVVYITGHGDEGDNNEGVVANNNGQITGTRLSRELKDFKPCVDIIVIIDACHSGLFTEPLKDVADLTMTSASGSRSSFSDIDYSFMLAGLMYHDENPEDEGGEYTSSLVAGWEEILKDPRLMNKVKARAYEEGITTMDALISQAYEEAKSYDFGQHFLFSNPQTSFGSEKSHCEAGSGVSLPDPTPTPTITPSPTPEPTPTPEEGTCAVFEDLEIEKTIMRHMRDCNPTLNFYYKLDSPVPGLASESPSPWDYSVLVNGKEGNCFLEEGFNDRLYCRVDISPNEASTLGHFELFANPCQEPISVLDLTIPELEGCGDTLTETEEPCDE